MISTLWALNSNDLNTQLSGLTPTERAKFAEEGNTEKIAAYCKRTGELLNPSAATSISLIGKTENSPDEVLLDLYYDGEGKTRRFLMRRVEGAWQLQGLDSIIAN
jgi:hypothetical protein